MEMDNLKGKLVLIMGPSGVGKGTIIKMLRRRFPRAFYVTSDVTRKKRPNEVPGVVYNFISRNEFQNGIKNNEYLEWACVHGKEYYGIPEKPVIKALSEGETVIREVDMQGFEQIRKKIPLKNIVSIFLMPESMEQLRERILRRGELPEEEIVRRMRSAEREMSKRYLCDYRLYSRENKLEELYRDVKRIIDK